MDDTVTPGGYAEDKPDIKRLSEWFDDTVSSVSEWRQEQQANDNVRFCNWPGKSTDGRKHGQNATPWDGASDIEVPLVADRIEANKAMLMNALRGADYIAHPIEGGDIKRAKVISNMLRWLTQSEMKEFYEQAELAADSLLHRGLMVTGQVYCQKTEMTSITLNADELEQQFPGLKEALATEDGRAQMVDTMKQAGMKESRAKKIVNKLNKTGSAEVPMPTKTVDRPVIRCLNPESEILFPPGTTDPQKAPIIFIIEDHTPESLRERSINAGWDKEWVEAMIEQKPDLFNLSDENPKRRDGGSELDDDDGIDGEIIQVVYAYQRLTDPDDGVPGIWQTIFNPALVDSQGARDDIYAKHQLLNYAHGEYPIQVTKLSKHSTGIYDTQGYSRLLRGCQYQKKADIDSGIDRVSITVNPPMHHPIGRAPAIWGPGVKIPKRVHDQYGYFQIPQFDPASPQMRKEIDKMSLEQSAGAHPEIDPQETNQRKQHLVNTFLDGISRALNQCYTLLQQYGPEEKLVRVAGVPEVVEWKRNPNERIDFFLSFNVLQSDPDHGLSIVKEMADLARMAPAGNFNWEEFLRIAAARIDPVIGNSVIMPSEQAQQKAVNEELKDIAEIFAGIPKDVSENDNHQTKMQILQQYLSQPHVQQDLAARPEVAKMFETRFKQRQFQIMQRTENAAIGRLGTKPQGMA